MPTEKMTALTLSGPIEKLDEAVRRFVVGRNFHPENAITFLSGMRRLKPVDTKEGKFSSCLAEADALMKRLSLKPSEVPFEEYDLEDTEKFLETLRSELREPELPAEESEDEKTLASPLLHALQDVPVSIRDLSDVHYIHVRLGSMPEKKWPELQQLAARRKDIFAVNIRQKHGDVYVLAMAVPEAADRLDANLSRMSFERLKPTETDVPDLHAAEILKQASERMEAAAQKNRDEEAQRQAQIEAHSKELLARRAWLRQQTVCAKAKSYAGYSFGRFYLAGWVPEEEAKDFAKEFEENLGFSAVMAAPAEVQDAKPPVRMKEKGPGSLLTPLLKMYGMPGYGTLDPRMFMVITYLLFFGMMFGDAGQGACIAVIGFLLYRKNHGWLWKTISLCGLCSIVFGLIYGSVFGLEDLLPWGGYHPLDADHIMIVLLAGAAVGVVVIFVCMVFNIINSLRVGDLKNAFFSPSGVAGMVFYYALIAAIVCAYTGVANLLKPAYVLPLIVLPLLLIWFGGPLAKLLQRDPNWKPDSVGMCIVEGFFDIFEAIISYMSNTMSFLRIGAFAISHAGMMMVVSMLCQNMALTGNIIVMVIGNIFVAFLEAALSSIQIIRLEFYEILGRFYIGGGHEFAPLTVDYTK